LEHGINPDRDSVPFGPRESLILQFVKPDSGRFALKADAEAMSGRQHERPFRTPKLIGSREPNGTEPSCGFMATSELSSTLQSAIIFMRKQAIGTETIPAAGGAGKFAGLAALALTRKAWSEDRGRAPNAKRGDIVRKQAQRLAICAIGQALMRRSRTLTPSSILSRLFGQ
jgi:hypothetical protein